MRQGSQRGYAKHQGVTHRTVQKWLAVGRITALPSGKIDFDAADAELNASGGDRRNGRRPRTLVEAQRQLVMLKTRLARLEYARRAGQLIPAADVKQAAFSEARRFRDRMLTIPDRIAPVVSSPDECDRVYALLSQEIHNALLELSGTRGEEATAS